MGSVSAPLRGTYMMQEVDALLGEFESAARQDGNGYALEKIGDVRSWLKERESWVGAVGQLSVRKGSPKRPSTNWNC